MDSREKNQRACQLAMVLYNRLDKYQYLVCPVSNDWQVQHWCQIADCSAAEKPAEWHWSHDQNENNSDIRDLSILNGGHRLWYPISPFILSPYLIFLKQDKMPEFETGILPTTVTDTNHPWSRIGGETSSSNDEQSSLKKWRERVALVIESHRMHLLVLFLVCNPNLFIAWCLPNRSTSSLPSMSAVLLQILDMAFSQGIVTVATTTTLLGWRFWPIFR